MDADILAMFQMKAGPVLFAMHVGYGMGALIAPKLLVAFVTTPNVTFPVDKGMDTLIKDNISLVLWNSSALPVGAITEHSNAVLAYPYSIAAVLAGLLSIAFLILFIVNYFGNHFDYAVLCVQKNEGIRGMLKHLSASTCTDGKPVYGVIFISLFSMLLFHVDGVDTAYRQYLYSFAINTYDVGSPEQASDLNLIYWVSFTVGRILSMLLSMKIPIPYILGTVVTLSVGNSIILDVLGKENYSVVLFCTILFGILTSSMLPACFLFGNYYIKMTGAAVGLGYTLAAAGTIAYFWLMGYLFDLHGPWACTLVMLVGNVVIAINYFVLQICACINGKRTAVSEK